MRICSWRGKPISPRKAPRPVSNGGSSSRATDWPRKRFTEREARDAGFTGVCRLAAGGNRIRTLGPTRPLVAAYNPTHSNRERSSAKTNGKNDWNRVEEGMVVDSISPGAARFVLDSPLVGSGFELPVPLGLE